jgi:tetratricopeptide (TPR) repeat protein
VNAAHGDPDTVDSAERVFLSGRTQDAVSILFQTLNRDPADGRAHVSLGVILHSLGQTERARRCFERALECREDDADARRNLALALLSLKEHKASRDELEKLLVKYPNEYRFWAVLSAVEDAIERGAPGHPSRRSVFHKPGGEETLPGHGGSPDDGPLDLDRIMQEDMVRRCTDRERKRLAVFLTMASGPEMNVLAGGLADYFDLERVMSFKYNVYRNAAQKADVVWLEGIADGNVHFLNERETLDGRKVVLRLSREDILNGAARKVSCARADAVFFESFCLRDLFLAGNPDVKHDTRLNVILKAVDTRSFSYIPRHGQRKIAAVVPERFETAEFLLLMEAFMAIRAVEPEAELHLSVGLRNMANEFAFQQFLSENGCGYSVFCHGHGEDLKTFLNSCHCFLTAESCAGGAGALEALILGLKPLIRSSPGASELYPESCLWHSLADIAALFRSPPDMVKISGLLKDMHRLSVVVPQYIRSFIAMEWF